MAEIFADRARSFRRDKPPVMEGFPMRSWSIEIWLLNEQGEEVPATVFEKATYRLHPSFEKRAVQSKTTPDPHKRWGNDLLILFHSREEASVPH